MYNTGQLPRQFTFHERYLILNVVGQGGMGCVYKAVDTRDNNRLVAIKEMRQSRLSPEDLQVSQQRFFQEASILQKLTPHSNIPTFYDAFAEQGRMFLVMDFIEGKTLQRILRENADHRLSLEKVIDYASQLCDVLSYLHQQSPPLVFRDLKPSNVIIKAREDHQEMVYLIDFGIARHFKAGQIMDTDAFGSLGYSAPELFRNEQTEPRSDLYSLGAMLHQCLTGRNPGENKPTFFDFSPIGSQNFQVPGLLDDLIMGLVATLPQNRPASASEVREGLNLIVESLTLPTEDLLRQYTATERQSYYDPQLAHEVQFRINWTQFKRSPGLAGRLWLTTLPLFARVGAWFLYGYLPFCRLIGERFLDTIQMIRDKVFHVR
jgi:serine/threonine protein kinase